MKYRLVGNTFRFGGGARAEDYHGPVVASADAFFLFIKHSPGQALQHGFIAAWPFNIIIGFFLRKFADKVANKPPESLTMIDASEIPKAIRGHADWPRINCDSGSVIVITKSEVTSATYGYFSTYNLETNDTVVGIGLSWFFRSRCMRFLEAAGWNELIDLSRCPSVIVQFAPFLGLLCGVATACLFALAIDAPIGDRGWSMELLAAIGAFLGMCAGVGWQYVVGERMKKK